MARHEFLLPDIGDFHDVDVVEVLASVGERVSENQSLIVLESDKATMEVPSPVAGVLAELRVQVGAKVNAGQLIAVIDTEGAAAAPSAPEPARPAPAAPATPRAAAPKATTPPDRAAAPADDEETVLVGTPNALAPARAVPGETDAGEAMRPARAHASPSIRHLARELGVDLALVPGTGRRGRVRLQDVRAYVK